MLGNFALFFVICCFFFPNKLLKKHRCPLWIHNVNNKLCSCVILHIFFFVWWYFIIYLVLKSKFSKILPLSVLGIFACCSSLKNLLGILSVWRTVLIQRQFSFFCILGNLECPFVVCWCLKLITLKAPRKKCIWKCRLLKSAVANNCLILLTNQV